MAAGKVLEAVGTGRAPTQTSCGWHTAGGAVTSATWLSLSPNCLQASNASTTSTPWVCSCHLLLLAPQGGWPLTTGKGKLLKRMKELSRQGVGALEGL